MDYKEIKNRQPELHECFFAFSNKQFEEGVKKVGIEGKKIYRGIGGLYGTHEGIKQLYDFYDSLGTEITRICSPQEVYDYEFANHECDYVGDDTEAIKIVASYFNEDKVKTVKRHCAHVRVDDLDFSK